MGRVFDAALLALLVAACMLAFRGDTAAEAPGVYYYGQDGLVPARPQVTGTFIQPWLADDWTDEDWSGHLDRLLSAGIDIVILQWTADTSGGACAFAAFPLPDGVKKTEDFMGSAGLVEGLLKAAEQRGVKVFVGLNTADDDWWSDAFTSPDWRAAQADAGNRIADALYGLYKARFPNAFAGWYWPWEMYGNRSGYGTYWAEMLNASLKHLTALDASMPLMFSPFMSGYIRLSAASEERMWTEFFHEAKLRPGDIFCPQDSVGGEIISLTESGKHLAAMKRAAGTCPGLLFWVNNENFTKEFKPAPLERFLSQLYVSGKYTDTHMCFSYSHYYDPVLNDPSFDSGYKAYRAVGVEAALGPAR